MELRLYGDYGWQWLTNLVAAAECSSAGRFIVRADQGLLAYLELESAIKTRRHNHECDCPEPMKNWEVVADNLKKAGFRCGCISSTDQGERQFWVVGCGA